MLTALAVLNYRTLRDIVVPLSRLTLVTGANGSGKSNLYRALRLLADTAQGGLIASLAREGGLNSTLWAGPETLSAAMRRGDAPVQGGVRSKPVSLGLGFAGEDFGYSVDLGLPSPGDSAFSRDPHIKGEYVWAGPLARPAAMLVERRNGLVTLRDGKGWRPVQDRLATFDSMLTQLADANAAPELVALRGGIRGWRFYDHLRHDAGAPARLPQVGTHTPVLAHDGADLAAALQTIREIGDREALDAAVADAFPGARVAVGSLDGRMETVMHQHGLLRPLHAAELSDGTLRYLLLVAALLSPRPPPLLVLNEPETSLHPDLLPALGRLIATAAERSQVIVVSHASRLIAALADQPACVRLTLTKDFGETQVLECAEFNRPAWRWTQR